MRYLGIDFGTKKVGLALSDEAGAMGFPFAIVPNDGRLIDYLRQLIVQKEVGEVVMGESLMLDGRANTVHARAKEFAQLLERDPGIPVSWESEQFTTELARRDPEGIRNNSAVAVDAAAAALILTAFLERKKNGSISQTENV